MVKYNLKHPITDGGKTITFLELRRPNAGDMVVLGDHIGKIVEGGELGGSVMSSASFVGMKAILVRLGGITDEEADKLDSVDLINATTEALGPLGEVGPKDGEAKTGAKH